MDSTSAVNGDINSNHSSHSSGISPAADANQDESMENQEQSEFEKQIMATSAPALNYCRLCLSKQQQLIPLFPPHGTPDKTLLYRILNCLTIALSFDRDFDSYICRICVQEVTKFFFYKEQCLANDLMIRGRQQSSNKVFFYGGNRAKSPVDESINHEKEPDNFEPIDSDEFDIPDEGGKSNDPNDSDTSEAVATEEEEDNLLMDPENLKPLPKPRAFRSNVPEYIYGGHRYTCASARAHNHVHWKCMYRSKLECRAAILVAPNGTVTCSRQRHNHQSDKRRLNHRMDHILDVHIKQKVPYKLISGPKNKIHLSSLICNGYKYRFAKSVQKKITFWQCNTIGCKAIVSLRMDFSSCSSKGSPHNHSPPIDVNVRMGDTEQPEQTTTVENGATDEGEGKGTRKNVLFHKGYEYGYPRADKSGSKWACVKKSLFNCPAIVYTTAEGKFIRVSACMHNHKPTDNYPADTVLDGYMTDCNTNEKIYYKLIPGKRGQRFVLYKGYRFSSDRLMTDGRVAWKCTKCRIFIIISGRFDSFEDRGGEHEHPTLEEDALEPLDMGYVLTTKQTSAKSSRQHEHPTQEEEEEDDEQLDMGRVLKTKQTSAKRGRQTMNSSRGRRQAEDDEKNGAPEGFDSEEDT